MKCFGKISEWRVLLDIWVVLFKTICVLLGVMETLELSQIYFLLLCEAKSANTTGIVFAFRCHMSTSISRSVVPKLESAKGFILTTEGQRRS